MKCIARLSWPGLSPPLVYNAVSDSVDFLSSSFEGGQQQKSFLRITNEQLYCRFRRKSRLLTGYVEQYVCVLDSLTFIVQQALRWERTQLTTIPKWCASFTKRMIATVWSRGDSNSFAPKRWVDAGFDLSWSICWRLLLLCGHDLCGNKHCFHSGESSQTNLWVIHPTSQTHHRTTIVWPDLFTPSICRPTDLIWVEWRWNLYMNNLSP